MNNVEIKLDDLSDGAVENLLQQHLKEMHKYSPPDSIHALDSRALRDPSITFWGAWVDNELASCGALKEIDAEHGEIKSMKTSLQYIRKGMAKTILSYIINEARNRAYSKVSLETGTNDAFQPARTLYEKFGFRECGPFGNYVVDPYSTFYSLDLS